MPDGGPVGGRALPGRPLSGAYARLRRWAAEGRDFTVELRRQNSPVLVMAPHGGRIEPGTGRLAAAIAGDRFSLYCFRGRLESGNRRLHLPSHLFDEPRALAALERANVVVAVHGHQNAETAFVMVGGLDRERRRRIAVELARAGFPVRPPSAGLAGEHPANICNRGRSGKGVQMEISAALRRHLRRDPDGMARLVRAVRRGLRLDGSDGEVRPPSAPSGWPVRWSPCRKA